MHMLRCVHCTLRLMASMAIISLGIGIGIQGGIENHADIFEENLLYVGFGFLVFLYDYAAIEKCLP